jgi:hypothetical protein
VAVAPALNLHWALGADRATSTSLWRRQPAKDWMEALPVGSGRLGAMYVATDQLTRKMQGPYNESYQPLGNLRVAFGSGENPG